MDLWAKNYVSKQYKRKFYVTWLDEDKPPWGLYSADSVQQSLNVTPSARLPLCPSHSSCPPYWPASPPHLMPSSPNCWPLLGPYVGRALARWVTLGWGYREGRNLFLWLCLCNVELGWGKRQQLWTLSGTGFPSSEVGVKKMRHVEPGEPHRLGGGRTVGAKGSRTLWEHSPQNQLSRDARGSWKLNIVMDYGSQLGPLHVHYSCVAGCPCGTPNSQRGCWHVTCLVLQDQTLGRARTLSAHSWG